MQQKAQKSKFVGPEEKRSEPVLGAEDQIRYIPNAVEITEDCPDNLEVLILEGKYTAVGNLVSMNDKGIATISQLKKQIKSS